MCLNLHYAIFYLYPTIWYSLMEDFALAASGAWAVLLLSVFAAWLVMIVLLIVLLPPYLLGILHLAIQKIALGFQEGVLKQNKIPWAVALRFPARPGATLRNKLA